MNFSFQIIASVSSTLLASGEGAAHHDVPTWQTVMFGVILLMMIATLAFEEKLHAKKSIITGIYAVVSLLIGTGCGLLPFGPVVNAFGESVPMPVYIPAIDWSVIAVIFGAGLFVDVTSQSGIFSWIAIKLTKASGGDPVKLLIYYGSMTVLFSAMLNNVTAMIIVGSLTVVSLSKLKREGLLLGFLLTEGLLTNVGGLLTLISSVPNIIVGKTAKIGFVEFFLVAAPYVLLATAITIWLGMKLFKVKGLATDEERAEAAELVKTFDENDGIESNRFFYFCAVMGVLFIIALSLQAFLPLIDQLGMGFVAIAFAAIVLLVFKHEVNRFYSSVDWDLLGFFAALFIVIHVMEHAQVLTILGKWIGKLVAIGPQGGPAALTVASAAASSVTDNIPLAAVLAKILSAQSVASDSPLWWSVIFGANLGGNITPIGSASTVVAITIIHKHKLEMSFGGFVVKAIPFAAVQIVMAIGYILGAAAVGWI